MLLSTRSSICGQPNKLPVGLPPLQCCHIPPASRSARRGHSCRPITAPSYAHRLNNSFRREQLVCHAADQSTEAGPTSNKASAALGIVLWAAFLGYALFLSPNQTPYRDQYFILKQVGLGPDDGFVVNTVWVQLFNAMGVWPVIYASLLIPTGRSGNKVPVWPFVLLSFAFGIFALAPYFAVWTPPPTQNGPPKRSEMAGWGKWGQIYAESRINALLLLASTCTLMFLAATAGPDQWAYFLKMFDESRFEHVTILDFSSLTLLAPYWVLNDASQRQWNERGPSFPVWPLAFFPFLGPALYLLLRPRSAS